MFPEVPLKNLVLVTRTAILLAALLAFPSGMLAQHGGGHGGGGHAVGGGGLSGEGRATGLDAKDDLKDFHEALAVQATNPQIVAFAGLFGSTSAARAAMQPLLESLNKAQDGSSLADRDANLDRAIEQARAENKKFFDNLSATQKSGLKETTKKLTKTDSDLDLQAKALDPEVRAKPVGAGALGAAQSLDRTLASFQSQQLELAEEMGIGDPKNEGFAFEIPPLKHSVNFAGQQVEITTTGLVSKGVSDGG
jgi:hypothetical protein